MLPIIAVVIAVIVAVFFGIAATRPATFTILRSAIIKAPAEQIFPHLNDFHRWSAWSPWEKLDPALQRTHSGAASGVGAVYEWLGNRKVGQGRMEITHATPPSQLTVKLDFLKPFEAHNTTQFTLVPGPGGTTLTWAMTGQNTFMGKVMGLFMNMDQLIGKDFEAGLANLKAVVEA